MHQTFANFAMVDQFATIKSAKPILLLVDTHDPCQNAIAKGQRTFLLIRDKVREGLATAKK